jgi:hypothetical protein
MPSFTSRKCSGIEALTANVHRSQKSPSAEPRGAFTARCKNASHVAMCSEQVSASRFTILHGFDQRINTPTRTTTAETIDAD